MSLIHSHPTFWELIKRPSRALWLASKASEHSSQAQDGTSSKFVNYPLIFGKSMHCLRSPCRCPSLDLPLPMCDPYAALRAFTTLPSLRWNLLQVRELFANILEVHALPRKSMPSPKRPSPVLPLPMCDPSTPP